MVIAEEILLQARHFSVMGYKACKSGPRWEVWQSQARRAIGCWHGKRSGPTAP